MSAALGEVRDTLLPIGHPVLLSRLPEHAGKPQYAVFVEKVEPQGTGRMRRWTLAVYCLTAKSDPDDADTNLDQILNAALDELDKNTHLHWTEAERGTANDSFNSFKISLWLVMAEE